jgi:archaellum component FlaG (FlaF/FlaG flagellin family)
MVDKQLIVIAGAVAGALAISVTLWAESMEYSSTA